MREGRTTVVTADTGSGKSTRVPRFCSEAVDRPVLVVEPRRVACRTLAARVAEEIGTPLGRDVGYAVRFEERRCADTRILFVTPGVALRLVAHDETAFGAWVLDEFHERGWQTDLLAALGRSRPGLPLVFTSATVEAGALAASIGAATLHAEGRRFPVRVQWESESEGPTLDRIDDRVLDALLPRLRELDGDVLIFLPGRGEVRRVLQRVRPLLPPGWACVEVHGGVSPEKLERAFRAQPGERRVYVATNVAETSVTLPGVVWVIDSGLERRVIHRGGRNVLALLPIAQSSMEQRAGRAGRVREGACLRLWGARWRPRATDRPEVERIALDELVVRAAMAGLDGDAFDAAPWVDPPPAFAVDGARARLRAAGLLDAAARLTELGRRAAELPLDALEAQLLARAPRETHGLLIDTLVVRGLRRGLLLPLDALSRARTDEVTAERGELLATARHEPAVRVHLLRCGDPRAHHLDGRSLDEARRSAQQLRRVLGVEPTSELPTDAEWEAVGDAFIDAWPEQVWVPRARAQDPVRGRGRRGGDDALPWTNGSLEVRVEPFAAGEGTMPVAALPDAGVLLDVAFVDDGRTGFRGYGGLLLPLRLRQLVGSQVGELHTSEVRYDRRRRRFVGAMERRVGEVVIESEEREAEGEILRRAVAGAVLEGRLFGGAGEALRDALHVLELVRDLPTTLRPDGVPPTRPEVPEDPEEWVRSRLELLGLQTQAELELLGEEDLRLDVEQRTGWPPWELERLAEDLPRCWEHGGARWRCEVRLSSGRVTLVPDNAAAAVRGPPPAALVPRFRGFRVEYRKASRVVPLRG